MKKILFISYGGGHVNALLPVYKKLISDKQYECCYLALTTASQILKNNELPFLGFRDLVDNNNSHALEVGRNFIGQEQQNSIVPIDESIAYMGLSYCDLVDDLGEQKAKAIYEIYGRQAFYPLNTLKRYFSKEKPDLVIATNSPRAERAAIDAASQLSIPSVCVVDLFAIQEISWIGLPGFASKVCVISDYVKDKMIASGRQHDETVVTGNPAFDELSNYQNSEDVRAFRSTKKWLVTDKVVLWASNIEPESHPYSDHNGDVLLPVKVEEELNKLVNTHPDIRVVIRPHPNDVRKPLIVSDRVEISTQGDDLNALLAAVDCVVVLSSTVGFQAALLRKPLVNIKLSIFSRDAPYDEMGISMGVDHLEELNSTILNALNHKPENCSLTAVGSATNNVINVIKDLLK
ncbi:hypothetical protein [Endozoicomonas ascidiicola]|uniref:capsular polysaccharide export protein, LipB/KpsS family n=1 Tax=Endozoicomonas ascidiicola TaxID=1698521 RepID=UPI0012FDAA19|nr:hypothetical protein [Endozoicomonas ascidiicola]